MVVFIAKATQYNGDTYNKMPSRHIPKGITQTSWSRQSHNTHKIIQAQSWSLGKPSNEKKGNSMFFFQKGGVPPPPLSGMEWNQGAWTLGVFACW